MLPRSTWAYPWRAKWCVCPPLQARHDLLNADSRVVRKTDMEESLGSSNSKRMYTDMVEAACLAVVQAREGGAGQGEGGGPACWVPGSGPVQACS